MNIAKLASLMFASINLSGCVFTPATYVDTSGGSEYSHLIGQESTALKELFFYHVSIEPNYGPTPSFCVVAAPPGFGGPEVLSKHTLPIGTNAVVTSVQRCTNCWFGLESRISFTLKLHKSYEYCEGNIEIAPEVFLSNFRLKGAAAANKSYMDSPHKQ